MFDSVGTLNVANFIYINWCTVNNTVELANSFFVCCVGSHSQRAHVLDRAIVMDMICP